MTYLLYGACVETDSFLDLSAKFEQTGLNSGNLIIGNAVNRQLGDKITNRIRFGSAIPPNLEFDRIVIPASNFIRENANYGHIVKELEKTDCPIVTIGLGAQAMDFQKKIQLTQSTLDLLRILYERAPSCIGVRGNYTAEVLFDLGIKNVKTIGCPTSFYNLNPNFRLQKASSQPSKLVANIAIGPHFKPYLEILKRKNVDIVLQDELFLLPDTQIKLTDWQKGYSVPNKKYLFFDVEEWSSYLKDHDFMFGPRMHGNMFALQNGIPSLWISHDSRTSELIDFLKLPSISLSKFEQVPIEQHYINLDYQQFNENYPRIYKNYRNFLIDNGLETVLPELKEPTQDHNLFDFHQYFSKKEKLVRELPLAENAVLKKGLYDLAEKTVLSIDTHTSTFKSGNQDCELEIDQNALIVTSKGMDPIININKKLALSNFGVIKVRLDSDKSTVCQLFCSGDETPRFCEKQSNKQLIVPGQNELFFLLEKGIKWIRFDPSNTVGSIVLRKFKLKSF